MTTKKERTGYIKRAKSIYEGQLRDDLVKKHKGYIIKIDGRSGEYAIGYSVSQSLSELKKQCDDPITYTARIGSDHVYDLPSSTIMDTPSSTPSTTR